MINWIEKHLYKSKVCETSEEDPREDSNLDLDTESGSIGFYCSDCDDLVGLSIDVYVQTDVIYFECKVCGNIEKKEPS